MEPKLIKTLDIDARYVHAKNAQLWLSKYATDDVTALFVTSEQGEPLATVTVNLSAYGQFPGEGNVFVKNWSENEGILDVLVREGVLSAPLREIPSGFVSAVECSLNIDLV